MLSESILFFKGRYKVTLSGKQKSELVQMADAVHYLVQTQLSFVAPNIFMGRLYTTGGRKRVPHLLYADL